MKNKTLKSLLMITFLAGTVTLVGCNNDNQTSQTPATSTNTIDVETELNTKKEQAIKEVEKYKNLNDYRQNEQNELNKFITEAKNSINKATSVNEIETIVNNFKTKADNLKTNADYEKEELEAYKNEKALEVESYKDSNNYRDEEKNQLANLITEAKNSINKASSSSEVDEIVATFKSNADNLKTNVDYEKEELALAIKNGIETVNNYVNPVNYRKNNEEKVLDLIDEYVEKVKAATSSETVTNLINEFKNLIDAIPVDTGFTGNLEKGAIVSFKHSDTDIVSDLFLKPDTNNWLGDGFAIRMKNISSSNMFINVFLNELDSDRVALATGASYYLYNSNGTKEIATSNRDFGYYMNVPLNFDGYIYIPYTSMVLLDNYGNGNKTFNYEAVYGLYLETSVKYDDYQNYQVGEIQTLNGDTINTVLSTSNLTSKNYTSKYIKDYNGGFINTTFNGEIEPEDTCIFNGSLNGSEISFKYTDADQLSSLRLTSQNINWSGEGFALRIKDLSKKVSYINIFINETDSDIALLKKDAPYTLYGKDGSTTEQTNNRGWGSYLILPASFDGYVYFPYSSFEYSRGTGDNKMTYSGIWGVYLETNTHYDFEQHFVLGSIEVKNGDNVTKVLDTSTITSGDYANYVIKSGNNDNINQSFYQE